ncbi:tetratricopeptide repeat protein [Candidatus Aalborgicola defluviihabitans]|uniref:tetratricopeptide repeat protein n=1 Tax=Candidatus Aalborgicola defluviihabitans TaxID=3386187 RepID=UPI001D397EA9|nr:sel1 repeat family protein [Rhodoferax sp.]MBK6568594.1 sel1 repeat family protein [Burkholderiales bacterium]MBK7281442.1 sel1 repeat family protein [Burkholderiales bacterium]MBK7314025.1 sel1 repeat family protein [Burkholderiales bacterium]
MTTVEFEQKPPLEPDTGKLAAPPLPEHNHLDAAYCHFTAEDIDQLRSNAEQGNSDAMVTLGYCYANGAGVPPNLAESVWWYRSAARQGSIAAMICLSACCRDGIGTRKDTRESMRWVRRALKKNEAALK